MPKKLDKEPECPEMFTGYYGIDLPMCKLTGKYCIREQGYDCESYEQFVEEMEEDESPSELGVEGED